MLTAALVSFIYKDGVTLDLVYSGISVLVLGVMCALPAT